jgi:ferritin
MSADCYARDLNGCANWFKVQAQEELLHVEKIFTYIHDRGCRVVLGQVEAPPKEWATPIAAFEEALKHEQLITSRINELLELVKSEKDHSTEIFLQWFVTEQIEEEATVREIVGQLKFVGSSGSGLYMIDRELSQRVLNAQALAE